MGLRPLRNNIIVRRIPNPDEHWLIPDSFRERSLRGEVIAVGCRKPLPSGAVAPCEVEPGDIVAFGQHASERPYSAHEGMFVKDDDELLVLSEQDILGVIE